MKKSLNTLVSDIYGVLEGKGGWDAAITEFTSSEMQHLLRRRLEDDGEERESALRMSNLGTPCERKLWYAVNTPHTGEPLPAPALLKFLYGDVIELLVLSLASAAGHKVEGCQTELDIGGIKGHRDAVIDGITVDVKSASPRSFDKFKYGELRDNDPFGYIRQLASYVYAGRNDEVESHPTVGAFLAVDKVSGEIALDPYDFSGEIEGLDDKVEDLKTMVAQDTPPERGFQPVDDGYYNTKKKEFVPNGNKKLGLNCSYCEFKHECWPGLRTFMYKAGQGTQPRFFTYIKKEPNVQEVT